MAPVPLTAATAIMLTGENIWHPLNQSLGAVIEPTFIDPLQINPDTQEPVEITPGDNWVQFVDSASGIVYAAPFRSIVGVQLPAPQAAQLAPNLVRATGRARAETPPSPGE